MVLIYREFFFIFRQQVLLSQINTYIFWFQLIMSIFTVLVLANAIKISPPMINNYISFKDYTESFRQF